MHGPSKLLLRTSPPALHSGPRLGSGLRTLYSTNTAQHAGNRTSHNLSCTYTCRKSQSPPPSRSRKWHGFQGKAEARLFLLNSGNHLQLSGPASRLRAKADASSSSHPPLSPFPSSSSPHRYFHPLSSSAPPSSSPPPPPSSQLPCSSPPPPPSSSPPRSSSPHPSSPPCPTSPSLSLSPSHCSETQLRGGKPVKPSLNFSGASFCFPSSFCLSSAFFSFSVYATYVFVSSSVFVSSAFF